MQQHWETVWTVKSFKISFLYITHAPIVTIYHQLLQPFHHHSLYLVWMPFTAGGNNPMKLFQWQMKMTEPLLCCCYRQAAACLFRLMQHKAALTDNFSTSCSHCPLLFKPAAPEKTSLEPLYPRRHKCSATEHAETFWISFRARSRERVHLREFCNGEWRENFLMSRRSLTKTRKKKNRVQ